MRTGTTTFLTTLLCLLSLTISKQPARPTLNEDKPSTRVLRSCRRFGCTRPPLPCTAPGRALRLEQPPSFQPPASRPDHLPPTPPQHTLCSKLLAFYGTKWHTTYFSLRRPDLFVIANLLQSPSPYEVLISRHALRRYTTCQSSHILSSTTSFSFRAGSLLSTSSLLSVSLSGVVAPIWTDLSSPASQPQIPRLGAFPQPQSALCAPLHSPLSSFLKVPNHHRLGLVGFITTFWPLILWGLVKVSGRASRRRTFLSTWTSASLFPAPCYQHLHHLRHWPDVILRIDWDKS